MHIHTLQYMIISDETVTNKHCLFDGKLHFCVKSSILVWIHIHNSIYISIKTNYQYSLHKQNGFPPFSSLFWRLIPGPLWGLARLTKHHIWICSVTTLQHDDLQLQLWILLQKVFCWNFLDICSSNSFQTKCQGWSNEVQRIWIWLKLNVTTCITMVSHS